MIDLIRSKVPAYKGTTQPTTSGAGMLSGFWCYLFGGSDAPAYRGAKEGGATAPAVSRCWWSFTGSPQYKTPPPPTLPPDVIAETADRYRQAYARLTGLSLDDWPGAVT